jgi:hypothetical protein
MMRKKFPLLIIVGLWLGMCFVSTNAQNDQSSTDKLVLDKTEFITLCRPGQVICGEKPSDGFIVNVRSELLKPRKDIEYRYSVSGGYLMSSGPEVSWNVEGLRPGTYEIAMTPYRRNKPSGPTLRATVFLESASCFCDCECPTVGASGPDKAKNDDVVTFTASISGSAMVTYNWTVENGEIISGQDTSEVRVRVKRSGSDKTLKATVAFSGLDPICACQTSASANTYIID